MSISTPRYLASFHPKQVPHFFTDILVIGSGFPHPYSYGLKDDSALRIGTDAIVYAITH